MRKLLASFLLFAASVAAQSYVDLTIFARTTTFTTAAPDVGFSEKGNGISSHQISWNPANGVSFCAVKLQTSPDGVTWTDLGVSQDCSTAGSYLAPAATANFIRMYVTSLTGVSVTVRYFGFPPTNIPTGSTIGNVNLVEVGGAAISLGQKTMANSFPVVIASDQSGVPISGTITVLQGTSPWVVSGNVNATQGTSPWIISGNVNATVTNFPATQPISGTVTANQGTSPWIISGSVSVTNFPATQPISGTVTANQGTTPWEEDHQQTGGVSVQAAQTTSTDGTGANEVVRAIKHRYGNILTTTPLAANAVFTGPWVDTNQTGDIWVGATARANVASATNGFSIQETDDTTDSNFNFNVTASTGSSFGTGFSVGANSTTPIFGPIRRRYWRVVYTNGTNPQASFKIATEASDTQTPNQPGTGSTVVAGALSTIVGSINEFSLTGDNVAGPSIFGGVQGFTFVYGPNGTTSPWLFLRTPVTFKTATATASGNTAVWTPTAGKKFRLMRYQIEVTEDAQQASPGGFTVTFQDSGSALGTAHTLFVPSTAGTITGNALQTGWIDMGNGILSSAANNVLNVNLSATLTAGSVRVNVAGTEE